MSIHTLEVIEEDQVFFLADNSGEKIKCIDSDEYISHSNARFIDFIIEDLDFPNALLIAGVIKKVLLDKSISWVIS